MEKPFAPAMARASVCVPLANGVELEHADRAVPDDGAGLRERARRSACARLRADVEDHLVASTPRRRAWSSAFASSERSCRPRRRSAAAPCPVEQRCVFASSTRSGSASDLPIGLPAAEQEGVGDAAADDQLSTFVGQRFEDRELGRDLRAGDDRDQRPRRVGERLAERVELGRHAAGRRRRPWRTARCRGCVASARCAVPKASFT